MGLIKLVTDIQLGLETKKMRKPKTRYAARGIVIDDNNKVALFYKAKKNEYKLPGDEIKDGSKEETFMLAALNETGCDIDIVYDMGTIEEWKTHENFKQISYVYIGKVVKNRHELKLSKEDKKAGSVVVWVTINEAIKLISKCYNELKETDSDSIYSIKFMVIRDLEILKYYKKNKKIINVEKKKFFSLFS